MGVSSKEGSGATPLRMGIDIGSKTIKIVVQDDDGELLYSSYDRHLSNVRETLSYVVRNAMRRYPSELFAVGVTGSAGMQLAGALGLPFTQEVVACRRALERLIPEADVAIEIGGEDSKILFLSDGEELRMNSTCAGGTGGFIDTIAGMLDVNAEKLNHLAHGCATIHPIASRCAVFAQMDVRPLLNEGVSREDIAGSVFDAVSVQCIAGLACGRPITGKVALLGGPLHFLSYLRGRFKERLGLSDEDMLVPAEGHLFVAQGAAFEARGESSCTLAQLLDQLEGVSWDDGATLSRLEPLFASRDEHRRFADEHARCRAPRAGLASYEGRAFLGVDSGSEAIKYALVSEDGRILRTGYERSAGNLMEVARDMLSDLWKRLPRLHDGNPAITIAHACVTGYGEGYLKQAFSFDSGEVETVSHVRAALELVPDVDFILDIGGQDIKCVYLRDGAVDDVVLNEACSSGCGALLSGMAWSMNVRLDRFVNAALTAENPVDLGTRCTVFMTSRVRHAQKEGASTGDISAGLAYSVVRNALEKVMRVRDASALGESIVVQGGTFSNDAVLRAFERVCGRTVHRPDIAAYMGAYGAALIARERGRGQSTSALLSRERMRGLSCAGKTVTCRRCPNACTLMVTTFSDAGERRTFTVGNRCERGAGEQAHPGGMRAGASSTRTLPDLFDWRYHALFDRPSLELSDARRGEIGVVRALDMYETYPFWHALLSALGFRVVLSCGELRGRALETIPSESVCYPAKLAHGQLLDLIDRGVDTVFLPLVDGVSMPRSACPVAAGYGLVLAENVSTADRQKVRFVMPQVACLLGDARDDFPDAAAALAEVVRASLASAWPDVTRAEVDVAVRAGRAAQSAFRRALRAEGARALEQIAASGARGIVLAGRPYHVDPAVHHGIPGLLRSCGYAVLTDDCLGARQAPGAGERLWEYPDRLLAAAQLVARHDELELVELCSFGCGLDAAASDKVRDVLRASGKMMTMLKIDEMCDLAAVRIRIRSLAAAQAGIIGLRTRELRGGMADERARGLR